MRARRSTLFGLLLVAGSLLLLPAAAGAQCTGSRSAVVVGSPLLVVFPTVSHLHYDAGWVVYSGPLDLTVTPQNQGQLWDLCARAASAILSPLGKPIGHLQIRVNGGPWLPLSSTEVVVYSDRQARTVPAQLRMQLSWDADPPGSYSALLTFSATQP
jgi:hypothetical protein